MKSRKKVQSISPPLTSSVMFNILIGAVGFGGRYLLITV